MSYYYPTGSAIPPPSEKTGVYHGSLTSPMSAGSLSGSLGYPQPSGLPPGAGGHSGLSSHTGLPTTAHPQAYGSIGATHGYAPTTGYATLGTSPYGAPTAIYPPSTLGYHPATLAPSSAYLAGAQSSYAGARVPSTTASYPGTFSANSGMYGYSSLAGAPMTTATYGHTMGSYPAQAMPSQLSSYPTVTPGGAHLGPGTGYPGASPYTRPIP